MICKGIWHHFCPWLVYLTFPIKKKMLKAFKINYLYYLLYQISFKLKKQYMLVLPLISQEKKS